MSRLLLGLAQDIVENGDKAQINVPELNMYIRKSDKYVTLGNVSGLLILYWPASSDLQMLADIFKQLYTGKFSADEVTKQEVLQLGIPDELVEETTLDLIQDIKQRSSQLGFNTESPSKFNFVQSVIQFQSYIDDMDRFKVLFDSLEDIPSDGNDTEEENNFSNWYLQVFQPFCEYKKVHGEKSFNEYANGSFETKFEILSSKLNQSNCGKWLKSVLFPYLGTNLSPLVRYIFSKGPLERYYLLWGKCIVSAVENGLPITEMVENYLSAIYFYGIKSTINKRETMRIYDSVKDTLIIANAVLNEGSTRDPIVKESDEEAADNFEAFLKSKIITLNESTVIDLSSLLEVNTECCLTLIQTLEVCEKLNTTTNMTISKYLYLKYAAKSFETLQKEALKIMQTVNDTTWPIVSSSIFLFQSTFTSPDDATRFNEIILNRLLSANMMDAIKQLYEEEEAFLTPDQFFKGVVHKFWESFDAADSFNDKSDKLKIANLCIPLLDLTTNGQLSNENHNELIRIKHLLKAIILLKNFKMVSTKPRYIIDNYSPIDIVGHILEQNGKSYLAYEKLFKILNELSIFYQSKEGDNQFVQLLSMCIESALIDGNFSFAYQYSMQLFDQLRGLELGKTWLTFYQVGNFSSAWDEENVKERIDILLKQKEILSLLLKHNVEESIAVLNRISIINNQLNEIYQEPSAIVNRKNKSISSVASEIVNEATHTTHHASEKLSNLFVSGLGWAIGANK